MKGMTLLVACVYMYFSGIFGYELGKRCQARSFIALLYLETAKLKMCVLV